MWCPFWYPFTCSQCTHSSSTDALSWPLKPPWHGSPWSFFPFPCHCLWPVTVFLFYHLCCPNVSCSLIWLHPAFLLGYLPSTPGTDSSTCIQCCFSVLLQIPPLPFPRSFWHSRPNLICGLKLFNHTFFPFYPCFTLLSSIFWSLC